MRKISKISSYFRAMLYAKTIDDFDAAKNSFTRKGRDLQLNLPNQASQPLITYMNNNWFSCPEMWSLVYRLNLMNFGTNTNNPIERFNRTIKGHLNKNMHLSECLTKLMNFTKKKYEEDNLQTNLKLKKALTEDCLLLQFYISYLSDRAIKLVREQEKKLNTQEYTIDHSGYDSYLVTNNTNKSEHTVTRNHVNQLSCNCQFYVNFRAPCAHILKAIDSYFDIDQEKSIDQIIALNDRWLNTKTSLKDDNNEDEIMENDVIFLLKYLIIHYLITYVLSSSKITRSEKNHLYTQCLNKSQL